MIHVIVNPAGAGGKTGRYWEKKIQPLLEGTEYQLHLSMEEGAAERICAELSSFIPEGETVRILILGGDGTIMDSACKAAERRTPILGINLGRLGYLAELEMSELDLLDEVMKGNYTVDKRAMLKAEIISKNKEPQISCALNEAVISNGSIARIIDLQLSEGGRVVNTYRADGLIVCTPTGSTAYSMSAGGPIADPRLSCFCVTPICPHMMNARPILFPDDVVLEVKHICKREKVLYLTLDGRNNYELLKNDVVRISKSDLYVSIIHVKNRSFYEKMRYKFH
jgi:NAD+ kinase